MKAIRRVAVGTSLGIVGAMVVCATIMLCSRPRDIALLPRCRQIARLENQWYEWVTNEKVAICGPDRQSKPPAPWNTRACVLMDIRNGKLSSVPGVSRDIQRVLSFRDSASFSTDGNWMLLAPGRAGDDAPSQIVRLDNHRNTEPSTFHLKGWRISSPLWDSRTNRWTYIETNSDFGRPMTGFRTVNIGPTDTKVMKGEVFPIPRYTTFWGGIGCDIVGFRPTGRAIVLPEWSCYRSKQNRGIALFEVNVTGPAKLKEFVVPLSGGRSVLSVSLNPAGDRLAIISRRYDVANVSWALGYLSRWLPQFKPKAHLVVELSTVGLDGQHEKLVGTLPCRKDEDYSGSYRIRWLPSGKQLSFIEQSKLYVYDVDRKN